MSTTADLTVTISDAPAPVTVNQQLTYTVVVYNAGLQAATGVVATGTKAGDMRFLSLTKSQGSCSKAMRSCSLGTIQPGASATVIVRWRTRSPGTVPMTASATANETDPSTANNTDTESTTVTGRGGGPRTDGSRV